MQSCHCFSARGQGRPTTSLHVMPWSRQPACSAEPLQLCSLCSSSLLPTTSAWHAAHQSRHAGCGTHTVALTTPRAPEKASGSACHCFLRMQNRGEKTQTPPPKELHVFHLSFAFSSKKPFLSSALTSTTI